MLSSIWSHLQARQYAKEAELQFPLLLCGLLTLDPPQRCALYSAPCRSELFHLVFKGEPSRPAPLASSSSCFGLLCMSWICTSSSYDKCTHLAARVEPVVKKPLPVLLVSELLKPRCHSKAQTVNNKHNAVRYIGLCNIPVQLRLPPSNNGTASCPNTNTAHAARGISSYLHINSTSLLLILSSLRL